MKIRNVANLLLNLIVVPQFIPPDISVIGDEPMPLPGIPTAPRNLTVQRHGANSVLLQWQPSLILNAQGQPINKPLIGKHCKDKFVQMMTIIIDHNLFCINITHRCESHEPTCYWF